MRKFYLYILVTLLWPAAANATVIEFNGDGSVTTHIASDYLAAQRHSRKKPVVRTEGWKRQSEDAFHEIINAAAITHGIDPNLIHAIIETESHYRPQIVSKKGAQGLMQLMPRTGKAYGVQDPFDPEDNINGGTRYLKYLLNLYDGDLKLTLAAYNAGEGNVQKYGGIPPFQETKNYIEKVSRKLKHRSKKKLNLADAS